MERWGTEPAEILGFRKGPEQRVPVGKGTYSAAETTYSPAPKECVLTCSWVGSGLLAATVRKWPWWLFQLSPRDGRELLSSERAGAARGYRAHLLRSSLRLLLPTLIFAALLATPSSGKHESHLLGMYTYLFPQEGLVILMLGWRVPQKEEQLKSGFAICDHISSYHCLFCAFGKFSPAYVQLLVL